MVPTSGLLEHQADFT